MFFKDLEEIKNEQKELSAELLKQSYLVNFIKATGYLNKAHSQFEKDNYSDAIHFLASSLDHYAISAKELFLNAPTVLPLLFTLHLKEIELGFAEIQKDLVAVANYISENVASLFSSLNNETEVDNDTKTSNFYPL